MFVNFYHTPLSLCTFFTIRPMMPLQAELQAEFRAICSLLDQHNDIKGRIDRRFPYPSEAPTQDLIPLSVKKGAATRTLRPHSFRIRKAQDPDVCQDYFESVIRCVAVKAPDSMRYT